MKVSIDSTTNAVSISDSGILATPSYVTRTFEPTVLVRQFSDFFRSSGDFHEVVANSGTVIYTGGSVDEQSPGLATLSTFTGVSGSSAAIRNSSAQQLLKFGVNQIRFEAKASLTLATPGEFAYIRSGIGFFYSQAAGPTDGAFFRCGTYTGLTTSTNWYCTTIRDGTATNFDTGLPVGTMRRLSIEVNASATQVVFRNNGQIVYTSTTNIPSLTSTNPYMFCGSYIAANSASVGANQVLLDYMLLDQYVNR
jgi:hypothetical protein